MNYTNEYTKKRIKFYAFAKILLLVATVFLSFENAHAQLISYPTAADSITRGLDTTVLTVRIDFPACTSPSIKVELGATNAPGVVEYIPSSVSKIGGSASLIITESSISDLQNPIFNVSSTSAGQYIIFTIKRRVNCGSAAATKDNIIVSGGCSFSETDPSVNTYNLLAPALTIVSPAALSNVDLGNTYNRTISINNGGNGCLDTLGFWVKYPSSSITLNSLKIGATVLTPSYSSADSSYFKISGTVFGADKLFCNGESISFTENITILKCNATTTYGTEWFAHLSNLSCEKQTTSSGMTMSNNLPFLTMTMPSPNKNFCPDGTYTIQRLRVVNTGAGSATNFQLSYWGWSAGARYLSYTDTTNWVLKSKTGTILGSMQKVPSSTPTNSYSTNNYNASCALDPTWYDFNVQMTLPNLIIPAGDTIYIEYRVYHSKVTCTAMGCFDDYYGWEDNEIAYTYKDQCGNGNNNSPRTVYYATGYPRAQYVVQGPPDINAGAFNMNLNYSSLISVVKPIDGRSYIFIKLPADITLSGAITSSLSGAYPATLSSFQLHDTLFIRVLNNTHETGVVTIPLLATCGSGGIHNFKIGHLHWWDSTNCPTAVLSLACRDYAVNMHCPTPCPKGGATPRDFQLKRISYGYPDNDNNNYPDSFSGLPDTTKINRSTTLNGDTVLGTWNINVYPNTDILDTNVGLPFNHFYIDYPLTALPASSVSSGLLNWPYLFNPLQATATIYTSGGGAAYTCTISPSITSAIAHYDFSSCKSTWSAGDSIVVNAKFIMGGYCYTGGYTHAISGAEVYASYVPKTTPTTAPIDYTTYTCDHFQSFVDVFNSYAYQYNYDQIVNGCGGRSLYVGTEYSILDNGYPIKFPFEARMLSIPDSVTIRMPAGFTYEANSAYMQQNAYGGFNGAPYSTTSIPAANISVSGSYLSFRNLKSLFTLYGGTNTITAEYSGITYNYKVVPTCEAPSGGVLSTSFDIVTAGNGYNTPSSYHQPYSWGGHHSGDSTITSVTYNAPQPIMTGGATVTSRDGTATWNVVLQNLSNSLGADNSWFYFTPINGITDIVVKEGATTILPDANGFYRLGTLAVSANRNFTISAKTTSCSLDSMRINEGFDCLSYPTSFSLQSCTKTAWLKIDNYQSQIQLTVAKQPSTSFLLCSGDSVEFVMNSAQAAFADNPKFRITPPTGLSIASADMEYPLGSGNWENVLPTISGGIYTYNVEDHAQVAALWGTRGLPGTIDFSGTSQRQVKLRIGFTTDCDFTSGAKIQASQFADRPCGVPIVSSLGFGNIVRTNPVKITGAGGAGFLALSSSLSPLVINCDSTNFGGTVTPIGSSTTSSDTIIVTLQSGLVYAGGLTSSGGITLASTPAPGTGGTQIIKLKVPSGALPGIPIDYSFKIAPDYVLSACGSLNIVTDAVRSFAPLTCGLFTCPSSSKVIIGNSDISVTVNKPNVKISSMSVLDTNQWTMGWWIKNKVVLRYNNINGLNDYVGNTDSVEFFCGSSTTPFAVRPLTKNLAIGASDSDYYEINIPISSCVVGDLAVAKVQTVTTSGSVQCNCSPSSFTLTGVPLPLNFLTFNSKVIECGVTIDWTFNITNNYLLEHFVIERSNDGITFEKVATLDAYAHHYIDLAPFAGRWMYRIKAIGKDGKSIYSSTMPVETTNCVQNRLNIYPNPAKDQLLVVLQGNYIASKFQLIDVLGRIYISGLLTPNSRNLIDLNNVVNGLYILKIATEDTIHTRQIQIVK